jgi:hypothetical protein
VTKGFPPCSDSLVQATKLNQGLPHTSKHQVQPRVYWAHANGPFKATNRFLVQPCNSIDLASAAPCHK